MKRTIQLIVFLVLFTNIRAQQATNNFMLTVADENAQPIASATVQLFSDNKLVKTIRTDNKGIATFQNITAGNYTCTISNTGYQTQTTAAFNFPAIHTTTIT